MNSTQLRALLASAGLSQRAAARELHLDERTMRRYCASAAQVPRCVEYALLWVVQLRV